MLVPALQISIVSGYVPILIQFSRTGSQLYQSQGPQEPTLCFMATTPSRPPQPAAKILRSFPLLSLDTAREIVQGAWGEWAVNNVYATADVRLTVTDIDYNYTLRVVSCKTL